MDEQKEFTPGQTIYILLTDDKTQAVVDDWLYHHYPCDLHVRRSKRKGMFVVSTTNLLWASRIIKWFGSEEVIYR